MTHFSPGVSTHGLQMSQMTQFYTLTHFDVFCETSVILFCSCCLLVFSALWFLSLVLVHFILVIWFCSCCFYSSLVHSDCYHLCPPPPLFVVVVVVVVVPCYILLSFDFVSCSSPGFIIIVLVFPVPHIKLVYLFFFSLRQTSI